MRYAKGHGTGNDFIIVPDLDDRLELGPELVRRLCDRHTGIGADGVLRVVSRGSGPAPWFMDYRNGDGSIAEMCGNGIRVFARYLIDHGLAAGPDVAIATRAGVRKVRQEAGGELTVDMGPVTVGRAAWALIDGRRYTGHAVSVGNPHLVCLVGKALGGIDLSEPPEVDADAFPDGVNVEIVRVVGEHAIEMRVHERGSGETLSCGTGAVAAAAGAAAAAGEWPGSGDQLWTVDVAGGRLAVAPNATAGLLTGPAVIVAEGETCASWLTDPLVTASVTARLGDPEPERDQRPPGLAPDRLPRLLAGGGRAGRGAGPAGSVGRRSQLVRALARELLELTRVHRLDSSLAGSCGIADGAWLLWRVWLSWPSRLAPPARCGSRR